MIATTETVISSVGQASTMYTIAYVWRMIKASVLFLGCKEGGGASGQNCVQNKIHGEYIMIARVNF